MKTVYIKGGLTLENARLQVQEHFTDVGKMVDIGSNTQLKIDNTALTRIDWR